MALAAGLLAPLAGCVPPPAPPTLVRLTLTAGQDANPAASGQGAPVQIVVYQLASASAFNSAEFFQLFGQDQATLGTDLIKRDTFMLAPGQSTATTLSPTEPVRLLGVVAAYQDFRHATWRAAAEIPAHQTTVVTIAAGHDGITVATGKPGS